MSRDYFSFQKAEILQKLKESMCDKVSMDGANFSPTTYDSRNPAAWTGFAHCSWTKDAPLLLSSPTSASWADPFCAYSLLTSIITLISHNAVSELSQTTLRVPSTSSGSHQIAYTLSPTAASISSSSKLVQNQSFPVSPRPWYVRWLYRKWSRPRSL